MSGSVTAFTSLSAATAVSNGLTKDFGAARANITAQIIVTGSVTVGAVRLELSQDGSNWTPMGSLNLGSIDGGNFVITAAPAAWRYARCSIVRAIVGATVTGLIMGGDEQTLVKPYTPVVADILSGGVNVVNTTTSTTIITIPAGRTWYGCVNFAAQYTGGAGSLINDITILTAGTNVTPAAGTIVARLHTNSNGNNAQPISQSIGALYVTAPVGNSVTLNIQLSAANVQFEATASANGVLL